MGTLECLQVQHPRGHALIALQGAQVLSYCPVGAQPVIWLSEQAEYNAGQPVRGGIPVCWPWFGDLRRNPAAVREFYPATATPPSHGWARSVDWQLDGIVETDSDVTLTLSVGGSAPVETGQCVPVQLTLDIVVGATLVLRLHNRSLSATPVSLTQALHTYFAISDIDNVKVEGLVDVPYIDTLSHWQQDSEKVPVSFHGEVDRIYQGDVAQVILQDAGWRRCVRLTASNSRSLVLWNPHIEKSLRLGQFAPDAWRRMVCIETANVMSDMLTLQPGSEHLLEVTIDTVAY
jgi:glucose-6-phosphate 1-epimerase